MKKRNFDPMMAGLLHHSEYAQCIFFIAANIKEIYIQLRPAIPDVKGPPNLICYWWIFAIANIGIKKKWLEGT